MEWQNFLNLCICQESQLQHVEDYRWVSGRAGGRGPETGVGGRGRGGGWGGGHQGLAGAQRCLEKTQDTRVAGGKAAPDNRRCLCDQVSGGRWCHTCALYRDTPQGSESWFLRVKKALLFLCLNHRQTHTTDRQPVCGGKLSWR